MMGLFSDKLLLEVNGQVLSNGELIISIIKKDEKMPYLLPFSCLSFIRSNFINLHKTALYPFVAKLAKFVKNPDEKLTLLKKPFYMSGFEFWLYKTYATNPSRIYNQYEYSYIEGNHANKLVQIQSQIEIVLLNYLKIIYAKLNQKEKESLRFFLINGIRHFQVWFVPMAKSMNFSNLNHRKHLIDLFGYVDDRLYNEWVTEPHWSKIIKENELQKALEFKYGK